jgi:hypothetical protein
MSGYINIPTNSSIFPFPHQVAQSSVNDPRRMGPIDISANPETLPQVLSPGIPNGISLTETTDCFPISINSAFSDTQTPPPNNLTVAGMIHGRTDISTSPLVLPLQTTSPTLNEPYGSDNDVLQHAIASQQRSICISHGQQNLFVPIATG